MRLSSPTRALQAAALLAATACAAAEPGSVSTPVADTEPATRTMSAPALRLSDVVVVATAADRALADLPFTAHFIGPEEIQLRLQPRSLPDQLQRVPGVLLQRTAAGMTSPHLRGFTGQRVVLVADGVRVNNSFLREGPNQYWNLLNPLFYDHTEVLMGPASVLYGSDAIGGVVNTCSTPLTRGKDNAGVQWLGGQGLLRFSSAEKSFTEYLEGETAWADKLTIKAGVVNQSFGELRTGDSTDNPGTGYDQGGVNIRARYWLNADESLLFGFDQFLQDDVNRVHQTRDYVPWHGTTVTSGDRTRLYDMSRDAAFARYEKRHGEGAIRELDLGLSWQGMNEDYRAERPTQNRIEYQTTDINTLGLNLRLQSPSDLGTWTYGADYYQDFVQSDGRRRRLSDGRVTYQPQGQVADDATYRLLGAYVQNEIPLGEHFELVPGVRYTYADLDAEQVNLGGGTVGSLSGNWDAVTGSLRLGYKPLANDRLLFFTGLSQGFRAPNLSDTTRDGEFGGGAEQPTANLDAEHFLTWEAGVKTSTKRAAFACTYYYTWIHDRIGRLQTPVTKRNLDDGYVQGLEASGAYNLTDTFRAFASIAWQEGAEDCYYNRTLALPGDNRPMSRMMPITGQFGIRCAPPQSRLWAEVYSDFAGPQHRLADDEMADNRYPPAGTPGYAVLGTRVGYQVAAHVDLTAALENLVDKAYRIHGSGTNEPGRNLVVTLRVTF